MDCVIRYGEIGLKGQNRTLFEKRLVENIRDFLKKNNTSFDKIERPRGRIIIKNTEKNNNIKTVFGIHSYSWATEVFPSLEAIKKEIINILPTKSFRISCKRSDKQFPIRSVEIEKEIGAFVVKETGAKVDLKNFKEEIGIEIIKNRVFIFNNRNKAFGGLPLGSQGTVLSLCNDKASLLATLLIMKRGCKAIIIQETDISKLEEFHHGFPLIIEKSKEFNQLAEKHGAKALVTGDTLDNYKEYKIDLLVLRPLIGFDKEKINNQLKRFNLL